MGSEVQYGEGEVDRVGVKGGRDEEGGGRRWGARYGNGDGVGGGGGRGLELGMGKGMG